MRPQINKLGTIDCDMVETNPIVFKDRLYRFESVRKNYHANVQENCYFRFVDCETGEVSQDFAYGYHLGRAFVEYGSVWVTAVTEPGSEYLEIFVTDDLKYWEQRSLLHLPGWEMYNSSVCTGKEKHGFVVMFGVGMPKEEAGVPLTARFATSDLLGHWVLTSRRWTYARGRYTAPHCLRYANGYYYNFYLEANKDKTYEQCVVRSKNLYQWEKSPLNPVLKASPEDRRIANPALTAEQRERIATAVNISNSNIGFCEYQGKLVINYSWGDQHGVEHLALAEFEGTEVEFLEGWFPEA